jgi:hypothetical protein
MKINFIQNKNFYGKIVYNDATQNMKNLLNLTSSVKDVDVFGGLAYSINKMLPNNTDKFMFTQLLEDSNPYYIHWKAKIIHKDKEKYFSSSQPYVISKTDFPEESVFNILETIYNVANSIYANSRNKPKFILPDWSNFRKS